VGLTHALRGNPHGTTALVTRGRGHLAPYAADPPYRIDVPGLLTWADGVLAAVDDVTAPTPGVPVLRLPGG